MALVVAVPCLLLPVQEAYAANDTRGAKAAPAPASEDDEGDDDEVEGQAKPLAYVDLTTFYTSSAGPALFLGGPGLASLTLSGGASKSVFVDAPLTVDFNDRFSMYVSISGSSFQSGPAPWTSFRPDNWRIGLSADVIEQQGSIPTVTLWGFLSRPFDNPDVTFLTTTTSLGADLDRSLDADETWGLLAGGSFTRIVADRSILDIKPAFMLYAGAYHRFDDWKLSGRAGFQVFGGAQLGAVIQLPRINTAFLRMDLERLDDDDNRLFGVAAIVGWSPKLSFQIAISTPIFFNK